MTESKSAFIKLYEDAFYKFIEAALKTSNNSEQYLGMEIEKQNVTQDDIRDMSKAAAIKFIDKLYELGYNDNNIGNVNDNVSNREIRNALKEAIREFNYAHRKEMG